NKVGCGNAWSAATDLPFDFATALRVDLVQPPWGGPTSEGIGFPYRGHDFTWITWGLALKLGDRAAFGFSLERSWSSNAYVDGLFGITAGLSWRPNSHFAFSVVAVSLNKKSPQILPQLSHPGWDAQPVLDGRYTLAMALRPTGTRDVEIGLEAQYYEGSQMWVPRGTLGIDIPYVGRAFGSIEMANLLNDDHRGIMGQAGLMVHYGHLGAGGG